MTIERVVTVTREEGLHARPARVVVDTATEYDADVTISGNGRDARATSTLELTALGVEPGAEVEIRAEGPDAESAIAAIISILDPEQADSSEGQQ